MLWGRPRDGTITSKSTAGTHHHPDVVAVPRPVETPQQPTGRDTVCAGPRTGALGAARVGARTTGGGCGQHTSGHLARVRARVCVYGG